MARESRQFRVDEDGEVIYRDEQSRRNAQFTVGEPVPRDAGGKISRSGRSEWEIPTKVNVDPSCATVPAAADPSVQKAALDALRRSVDNEYTGTSENGFFVSEKIFDDEYSVGPTFSPGRQHGIDGDKTSRMRPGLVRSASDGNYPPSFFVHSHPNNRPPSRPGAKDQSAADNLGIPVGAIDRAGNLFCVLPRKK